MNHHPLNQHGTREGLKISNSAVWYSKPCAESIFGGLLMRLRHSMRPGLLGPSTGVNGSGSYRTHDDLRIDRQAHTLANRCVHRGNCEEHNIQDSRIGRLLAERSVMSTNFVDCGVEFIAYDEC